MVLTRKIKNCKYYMHGIRQEWLASCEEKDRKFGTHYEVLMMRSFDPFGLSKGEIKGGTRWFYLRLAPAGFGVNIIHGHSNVSIFNWLHKLYKYKPIIMHYHDSDIRSERIPSVRGRAPHIFYATRDLANYFLPEEATWCPNPVDRKFYRRIGSPKSPTAAVSFNLNNVEETKLIAKKFGLELDILGRKFHWTELPRVLSPYSYYLDIKEDPKTHEILKSENSLSLTALQALSIGLKVIDSMGKVYIEFPQEHDTEDVSKLVYDIYVRLLSQGRV